MSMLIVVFFFSRSTLCWRVSASSKVVSFRTSVFNDVVAAHRQGVLVLLQWMLVDRLWSLG